MAKKTKKRRIRLGSANDEHRRAAADLYEHSTTRANDARVAIKRHDCRKAHALAVSSYVSARLARRESEQGGGTASLYLNNVNSTAKLLKEIGAKCLLAMPMRGAMR